MISRDELVELLREAGQAHHRAFRSSDGVDPEWPAWYAAWLQAHLGDRLGRELTRSELTYLLVKAEREQAAAGDTSPWPEFYADILSNG